MRLLRDAAILTLFAASLVPGALAQRLTDFGYATMTVNGRPARGERPLLVLLMEFTDVRFHSPHGPVHYDELFFGRGDLPHAPSLRRYFQEISGGRFTFRKADIVGPLVHPDLPRTRADESRFHCANNFEHEGRRLCPEARRDATWEETIDHLVRRAARKGTSTSAAGTPTGMGA